MRGASLVEVLVGIALLALLTVAVFAVFGLGTGTFHLSVLRQGLQGDARRVLTWLEKDVRRAVAASTSLQSRQVTVDGVAFHRDGVCLPGLSDWNDPARFSPDTGLPLWDRYLVYYATTDAPEGRLIRMTYNPNAPAVGPWEAFSPANHMLNTPSGNANQAAEASPLNLAAQVREFQLTSDGSSLMVNLKLRGQELSRWREDQRRDEVFEASMEIKPQNVLP